jgi:hypothetical protein
VKYWVLGNTYIDFKSVMTISKFKNFLNAGGRTTVPHPLKLDVLRNLTTDLGIISSE